MVMNGSYSPHCNKLKSEERYNRFIVDADSNRKLLDNMQKKYDDYVHEWYWVEKGWDAGAVLKDKFAHSGEAGKYAYQKLREAEVKPDEASLDAKAINVTTVLSKCNQYDELVSKYIGIAGTLEVLKDSLGSQALSVDNMNYEIRIDEIIKKINDSKKIMQEFVEAVKERAPFVHDFQVAVQKDYIRYYGNENSYGNPKNWSRANNGWDI